MPAQPRLSSFVRNVDPAYAATQPGHTLEVFHHTYAKWIDEIKGAEQREKVQQIARTKKIAEQNSQGDRRGQSMKKRMKLQQLLDLLKGFNGDPDGTRTRDLRRDRPAF